MASYLQTASDMPRGPAVKQQFLGPFGFSHDLNAFTQSAATGQPAEVHSANELVPRSLQNKLGSAPNLAQDRIKPSFGQHLSAHDNLPISRTQVRPSTFPCASVFPNHGRVALPKLDAPRVTAQTHDHALDQRQAYPVSTSGATGAAPVPVPLIVARPHCGPKGQRQKPLRGRPPALNPAWVLSSDSGSSGQSASLAHHGEQPGLTAHSTPTLHLTPLDAPSLAAASKIAHKGHYMHGLSHAHIEPPPRLQAMRSFKSVAAAAAASSNWISLVAHSHAHHAAGIFSEGSDQPRRASFHMMRDRPSEPSSGDSHAWSDDVAGLPKGLDLSALLEAPHVARLAEAKAYQQQQQPPPEERLTDAMSYVRSTSSVLHKIRGMQSQKQRARLRLSSSTGCEGAHDGRFMLAFKDGDIKPLPLKGSECGISLRLLRSFLDNVVQHYNPTEAQQQQAEKDPLLGPWPPAPVPTRSLNHSISSTNTNSNNGAVLLASGGLTTKQVVEWIVKPRTAQRKLRFVDMLDCEAADVGRPDYFISHAWSRPFAETVSMVLQHLASAEDTARVWIDAFAINQHQTDAQELQQFAIAIGHSFSTLVCLDAGATPLQRIWCLYEFDHTFRCGGDKLCLLHPTYTCAKLAEVFSTIDASKATAFSPTDTKRIQAEIIAQHESLEAFSSKLKLRLLLDPLSYTTDLAQLVARGGDPGLWNVQLVQAWLTSLKPEKSRVLCIAAGAGTGKSCLSAALLSDEAVSKEVAAHHFIKYNDQRRVDIVRIVKSLAYQLAARFPALQRYYAHLDANTLSQLSASAEAAYEMLLARPLGPTMGLVKAPIVILLDALDEADPVDEQAAAAAAAAAAAEAVRAGADPSLLNKIKPKLQSVVPCGNKVLQFIKNQLLALPDNVRLIVSTRPEAVAGRVLMSLRKADPGMKELRPIELRKIMLGAPGNSRQAAQASNSHARPSGLWGAVQTAQRDSTLASSDEMRSSGPFTVQGLGAAYESYQRTFQVACHQLDEPGRVAVTALLQVLIAAQEPLPRSLLQAMRLDTALPKLPGYGVLFFVMDHHVYLVHKSLADWLLDKGLGHPFVVDVAAGHLTLARHLASEGQFVLGAIDLGKARRAALGLRPYTLKYLVKHLVCADRTIKPGVAEQILEVVLRSWTYLEAAAKADVLPQLINDLALPEAQLTPFAADALRWLRGCQHELASDPGSVLRCALRAPLHSAMLQAAERDGYRSHAWRTQDVLLQRDWHALLTKCPGHRDAVKAVVFAGAGRQAVTGGADGTIRIHNIAVGDEIACIHGHAEPVTCVAASNNQRFFVSGSTDRTLRVWDAASGECLHALLGHYERVTTVAVGPNSKLIYSGSTDCQIRVWDADTGQCINTLFGHTDWILSLSCFMDGRLASSSRDKTICIWQPRSGAQEPIATHSMASSMAHTIAIFRDGRRILCGCYDTAVRVVDVASGQVVTTWALPLNSICNIALSPDGKKFAGACEDRTVAVWLTESGQRVGKLYSHTKEVCCIAFAPDGSRVLSGSEDRSLCVWDVEGAERLPAAANHSSAINGLAFSSSGSRFVSASSDYTLRVWLTSTSSECKLSSTLYGHTEPVTCVAMSRAGTQAASGSDDRSIRIWSLLTAECIRILMGHAASVTDVEFAPDGARLVSCSTDGQIRVWDVLRGSVLACMGQDPNRGSIHSVALTMDGKCLASAGADGTICLWDMDSSACIGMLTGHGGPVTRVTFAQQAQAGVPAQLASSSADGSVRIWAGVFTPASTSSSSSSGNNGSSEGGGQKAPSFEANHWQSKLVLTGHSGAVLCCSFSADGTHVASSGMDGTIRIHVLEEGFIQPCVAVLQGHTGPVRAVEWSACGARMISGGEDRTVRVHRLAY